MRAFAIRLTVFSALFLTVFSLKGQNNLTMYNMHTLPQRVFVNPAQIPDSRFFLGMPGFSSLHVLYANNGFKVKDVVSVSNNSRLQVHPMNFYNALEADNRIAMNVNYDILYTGFKLRKSFFTVGMGERIQTGFSFPKDFFGMLLIGNGGNNLGKDLKFNFGYDMMVYNDVHASWSRAFRKDKLRLGVSASYLNGLVNINTERSDLIFNTHPEDFHYTIRSNVKVNTSSILDTLNRDFNVESPEYNVLKGRNKGMSVSFGATYQLIPRVVLSASVINLGYINWKDNVTNYVSKNPAAKYEFYGLDLKDVFNDSTDFGKITNKLLDSISDRLEIIETHKAYRTSLPATFYLGGNFWFTKKQNLGVLFFGNYYQKKLNPAVTLSYNAKFTNALGVSVSYSIINRSFSNGGVGLTLNGGFFQYYLCADNILGVFYYRNANMIDLRTGINFTFLRKVKQPGLSGKRKK